MDTAKNSEDVFMKIRYWMKQNKVDGIWFDNVAVDDRYLKVTLTKNVNAKTWRISRIINATDIYGCYLWDRLEDMIKQLNDDIKKAEEDSK